MKDGWRVIESVSFTIPSLPSSMNSIYQIIFAQRRVEMKPEVRLWKTGAKEYIPRMNALENSFLFNVKAVFYYDFFYKNGKIKKVDTQNLLKVLCDAISEKCGFDDSLMKFGTWESYHDINEHIDVTVEQVTNEAAAGF